MKILFTGSVSLDFEEKIGFMANLKLSEKKFKKKIKCIYL